MLQESFTHSVTLESLFPSLGHNFLLFKVGGLYWISVFSQVCFSIVFERCFMEKRCPALFTLLGAAQSKCIAGLINSKVLTLIHPSLK